MTTAITLVREERDDNPFSWYRWQYDSAGRLLVQDGTLPGQSSGAGMQPVTRSKDLLRRSRTTA